MAAISNLAGSNPFQGFARFTLRRAGACNVRSPVLAASFDVFIFVYEILLY